MELRLIVVNLAAALVTALPSHSLRALEAEPSTDPSERRIPVGSTSLYARAIGRGQPVIILHGGPDFDHGYLLPDLDRLIDRETSWPAPPTKPAILRQLQRAIESTSSQR